jgi:hypothetical protein
VTARRVRLAGLLVLSLVAVACGPTSVSPTASVTATHTAVATPSVVASGPASDPAEPTPGATPRPSAGQTDTAWGRIWDSLPSGFPMYPGATPSDETAIEPATAVYVVDDAEASALATWFQDAFEKAAYHTDALSGPFEDGGYLLESSGDDPACRVSLTIAPLGGTTSLTVLYGAVCPHD